MQGVDPVPTAATVTAIPTAASHKRQISEAVPHPRGAAAATTGFGGYPRGPRGQIQALAQPTTPERVAEPGSPNGAIEMQLQSNYSVNGLLRIARIAQSYTPVTVIH